MLIWILSLVVGAAAAVFYAQSQKFSSASLVIVGVVGAIAGMLGMWLLGPLGSFVGQLAIAAVVAALAVVGLKAANILK
jgi:uncharacterized membrane protein YeaQ/YmgE (transglycosylase-associated protein family)